MTNGYALSDLNDIGDIGYLATPYTLYDAGIEAAAFMAARIAGKLMEAGVDVYSPIAECHAVAHAANLDPLDSVRWGSHCERMARRFDYLLIADMRGWRESRGVAAEVKWFGEAGKPVFLLRLKPLAVEKLR